MSGGGKYHFHENQYFLVLSYLHVQDGQTALYWASRNGHDRIVEELLNRKADVNHQTKVTSLMLWAFSSSICIAGQFYR